MATAREVASEPFVLSQPPSSYAAVVADTWSQQEMHYQQEAIKEEVGNEVEGEGGKRSHGGQREGRLDPPSFPREGHRNGDRSSPSLTPVQQAPSPRLRAPRGVNFNGGGGGSRSPSSRMPAQNTTTSAHPPHYIRPQHTPTAASSAHSATWLQARRLILERIREFDATANGEDELVFPATLSSKERFVVHKYALDSRGRFVSMSCGAGEKRYAVLRKLGAASDQQKVPTENANKPQK